MSNLATFPNSHVTYGENLAQAARGFIAALFAVKPPRVEAPAKVSMASRLASIRQLYAMAAAQESLSPSLAAELRSFADRS